MQTDILIVLGTRPEAIKLAPVFFALRDRNLCPQIASSGQHRELLNQTLPAVGLEATTSWDLMSHGQTPEQFAAKFDHELDRYLERNRPKYVVVQGDTATSLIAATVAARHQLPIGHIEAGIRSGNLAEPKPEEGNRREIARFATHHFAPTLRAQSALLLEEIDADKIFVTGNTCIDAMYRYDGWRNRTPQKGVALITLHRRENIGAYFAETKRTIRTVIESFPDVSFRWVAHPNPDAIRLREQITAENLQTIDAMSHSEMLNEMANAEFILSDSGGMQEEAGELGRPIIVVRNFPDRMETVGQSAWIAGRDPVRCCAAIKKIRAGEWSPVTHPYGDGAASERIADIIANFLDTL